MDQTFHSSDGQAKRGAFTLIELLVVVAIIAMLIAILLPSLAKARQTAKEVTCGVDIRTLMQVSIIYSNDYKGFFPRYQHNPLTGWNKVYPYHSYPFWRGFMEEHYGVQRNMYFSPNNEVWNDDDLYYFGWDGVDPDTADSMVFGRMYFGSHGFSDVQEMTKPAGQPGLITGIVDPTLPTSGTVFATRANDNPAVTIVWADLNRMWAGSFVGAGNRWGSNHLYNPDIDFPEGTHNGHMDGHVDWVGAGEIRLRISFPSPGLADLYW